MPRVASVATQKNNKGEITPVTFNLKKHKETILPIMEELGVVKKSKFMEEFERGISLDEFQKRCNAHIDKIWKK